MNTVAVALCLVLVAMASATYMYPPGQAYVPPYRGQDAARPQYSSGYPGNNVDNNQDFNQYATIKQQQSNKQAVDQDYYGRGGSGYQTYQPGGYKSRSSGGYQPDYSAGYRPGYPSGNEGNDIYNNQYPEQVAIINQQQSNKQAVDQDAISRGRVPGNSGYQPGGFRTGGKGYY